MTAIPQSLGTQVAPCVYLTPGQGTLMLPATIKCENLRTDGVPCGETALIHAAQYIYGQPPGSIGTNPELQEAYYTIDCPRCGRRTQVVRLD